MIEEAILRYGWIYHNTFDTVKNSSNEIFRSLGNVKSSTL